MSPPLERGNQRLPDVVQQDRPAHRLTDDQRCHDALAVEPGKTAVIRRSPTSAKPLMRCALRPWPSPVSDHVDGDACFVAEDQPPAGSHRRNVAPYGARIGCIRPEPLPVVDAFRQFRAAYETG